MLAIGGNFYPRPPRGGRRLIVLAKGVAGQFLSTPSARRATRYDPLRIHPVVISIHALREEGDRFWPVPCWVKAYFYPRPPRGGRLAKLAGEVIDHAISIHALREEGDCRFVHKVEVSDISIHALREEGDCPWAFTTRVSVNFYPRPPRGGRPSGRHGWRCTSCYFYPRPPRGGRLIFSVHYCDAVLDFYPRPPRGGRQSCRSSPATGSKFLSTPSARRATITYRTE